MRLPEHAGCHRAAARNADTTVKALPDLIPASCCRLRGVRRGRPDGAINAVRPKLWQGRGRDLLGPMASSMWTACWRDCGERKAGMEISYKGIWGYHPLEPSARGVPNLQAIAWGRSRTGLETPPLQRAGSARRRKPSESFWASTTKTWRIRTRGPCPSVVVRNCHRFHHHAGPECGRSGVLRRSQAGGWPTVGPGERVASFTASWLLPCRVVRQARQRHHPPAEHMANHRSTLTRFRRADPRPPVGLSDDQGRTLPLPTTTSRPWPPSTPIPVEPA